MSDDGKVSGGASESPRVSAGRASAGGSSSPKDLRFPGVDRADVERDAELFAAVASTRPGVVRTLSLLVAELADFDMQPDLLRGLAEHLHRLGDALSTRADRVTIDGD